MTLTVPTERSPRYRVLTQRRGALWAAALALGAFALTLLHLGHIVEYAFPVVTVCVAIQLVQDDESSAYLEFVLWIWLLDPEVRRIVDWKTGYHSTSPIVLSAAVATFVCLPRVIGRWKRRPAPALTNALLLIAVVILYGFAIGVLRNGASPALDALANALPPVLLGLYLLVAGPPVEAVRSALRTFFLAAVVVLGIYAIIQFFVLPGWDKFWMLNAHLNSIGLPEPRKVRVFSLLNSPSPFATFIGCALVPVAAMRSRWRWVALVVGFAGLGLSLVREAWIGWLAAALWLLWRRVGAGRKLGLRLLVVPVLLILIVGGPIQHTIVKRLSSTASNGTQDVSLQARINEYKHYVPVILQDPIGEGLGSTGTSTKLSNAGNLAVATGNFDGGLLVIGYNYGLVGGLLVIGAFAQIIRICRRTCPPDDAFAVGCVAVLYGFAVELLFLDVTTSITGIALWSVIAYVGLTASRGSAPSSPTDGPGAPRRSAPR